MQYHIIVVIIIIIIIIIYLLLLLIIIVLFCEIVPRSCRSLTFTTPGMPPWTRGSKASVMKYAQFSKVQYNSIYNITDLGFRV